MAFNRTILWLVIFGVTCAISAASTQLSRTEFLETFQADIRKFAKLEKQAETLWDSLKPYSVDMERYHLYSLGYWIINHELKDLNPEMIDLLINRIADLKVADFKNEFYIDLLKKMKRKNKIGTRLEYEIDDIIYELEKKYADSKPSWWIRALNWLGIL